MTDLPDDMNRWPTDPYALLGVTSGMPARDIRKAYTELIRRFKPERFPDQFRRIREAYDQVLRSEQWRALAPPLEPEQPPPPAPPEPPISDLTLDDEEPEELPIPRRPEPSADLDREDLWDAACAGEHERVYRKLRDEVQRGGAGEEVYLQLYWLRVAFPEVDWDVKPIDWAIKAIAGGHENGRALELVYAELLYRRELCRDPGLVQLSERVHNADVAARLYELRWRAALNFGQWSLVLEDLARARRRLYDHPQSMVSLLAWLSGHMAWSSEDHVQRAFRQCRKELESLASGNRQLDYMMERIDFLIELAEQWRAMPHTKLLHRAIYELLPITWIGTLGQVRWRIFGLYQAIVSDVHNGLDSLDVLAQSWPMALAQVVMTAQQTFFASRGSFRPQPDDVKAVFRTLFDRHARENPMRIDVLDFLARERLGVDDFLSHVPFRDASEPAQNLLAQMGADNSLRLINLAQLTLDK